jgi:hypothetical protein
MTRPLPNKFRIVGCGHATRTMLVESERNFPGAGGDKIPPRVIISYLYQYMLYYLCLCLHCFPTHLSAPLKGEEEKKTADTSFGRNHPQHIKRHLSVQLRLT